jgi:hypothetical protein
MTAMEIYEKLSYPPKSFLKDIEAGDLKGKTDINPQWRYKAMTELFGTVGIGWKYEIQKLWTEPGAKQEVLAFAQVAVYIRDQETKQWSDPIIGLGGSKLINCFSNGLKSNDEGYKMAVTDAFSTSLKILGVAAAIYEGRWDGSKYNLEANTEQQPLKQTAQKQNAPKQPRKQNGPALAGGPDTPEEKNKIKEILSRKNSDGLDVFTEDEKKQVADWRKQRTAAQVIQTLEQEYNSRAKSKIVF